MAGTIQLGTRLEARDGATLFEQLSEVHRLFRENEPRAFVYDMALRERDKSMISSILILLLVWNRETYRRMTGAEFFQFLRNHKLRLQETLTRIQGLIKPISSEDLLSVDLNQISDEVQRSFIELCKIDTIGPTAAAKILHLLVPKVFVMWDERIRQALDLAEIEHQDGLHKRDYVDYYSKAYASFLNEMQRISRITARQLDIDQLLRDNDGVTLPKLIDEYNYCLYTLHLKLPAIPMWTTTHRNLI
jgi:hypothetical protein